MNTASCPADLVPFGPQYRASGLLLHITSLPSPYGIGDVGPAAFAMADRLQAAGQGWWQALPLGPTGYGNSPYQSLSSFAGNGLLISPDGLIEEGLLQASHCQEGLAFPTNAVDYECHGLKLHQPDWSDQSHSLAISASAIAANLDIYLMLNAYWEPLRFELSPVPEAGLRPWRRWLDTFLESPDDVCLFSNAPPVAGSSYLVHPRSIVALARVAE